MTRGQDSLVIEAQESHPGAAGAQPIDLTTYTLAAVVVPADEQSAHDALLGDLDKVSGGKTLWRRLA
jgi:DNA polymerase-3 subunit epsilon